MSAQSSLNIQKTRVLCHQPRRCPPSAAFSGEQGVSFPTKSQSYPLPLSTSDRHLCKSEDGREVGTVQLPDSTQRRLQGAEWKVHVPRLT